MERVTQDCMGDCVTTRLGLLYYPMCHWLELTSIAVWSEVASFLLALIHGSVLSPGSCPRRSVHIVLGLT